jgi:hypothetical protein
MIKIVSLYKFIQILDNQKQKRVDKKNKIYQHLIIITQTKYQSQLIHNQLFHSNNFLNKIKKNNKLTIYTQIIPHIIIIRMKIIKIYQI